ncbi:protein translocase subunit SecA [Vulcanimicrobium alpinum]|uniref:Protein translocase subunit SecA n=1 Tax=Vulcanimicrobium alpinum TaxID=3016050 RepID=A0AAN1XTW0_UNVUL|nr:preprotein translocase subunit SecA [Vulcanimicrobium alpinum]BDE05506.1 protein translocase subunit SecA [Vulcanimicrobium alpinum]
MAFLKTLFDGNERELARLRKTVERVNALEPAMAALSDDELRAKTAEFKGRVEAGETLDALLPEAFAVVRETGKRVMGMRHFDVQIMGGQALHEGNVAEMRTGEGKTLVATLPVYLNALTGRGVHVVTVNDYLAKRDAEWMSPIYTALGMTVGVIQHDLDHGARKAAYDSDITYVTNNEVGFDYLRDNMAWSLDQMVQRHLNFAIVDEVDSILIDEARTPLIISGQGHDATELYAQFAKIIPRLVKGDDFTVDEKAHAAPITEQGVAKVEKMLGITNLYDQRNLELTHQLNAALKAWNLFHKDQQYIVKDGEVIIVDEFTGRLMYGRRYSDGIHQAIEAKEGLNVRSEDQTLATITFQNYFRLYDKLAGMTGTAKTEEREFREIYGLAVVVLPTNMPVRRKDYADIVYRSEEAKFNAVIDDIIAEHEKGRPVLVGTRSIEKSERLATLLRRRGIECNVLNAKYHEQEAQIIKDAGIPGKVTIATNMAGRGVDIKLGDGVPEAGGLHIIGTERHESRRIDNQLRGRAGRQGDPGTTRFYIALEDELMRLFGQERLQRMMDFVKFTDETPIEAGILSRSIENAQSKVENHNYEIRKSVLEYDDVMNKQREIIYAERRRVLEGQSLRDFFVDTLRRKAGYAVDTGAPEEEHPSEWNLQAIIDELDQIFPVKDQIGVADLEKLDREGMKERMFALALAAYEAKEVEVGPDLMRMIESQYIMLPIIDRLWVDHLYIMDALKSGIGLRGYGQKDPRVEYEKEAYEIFEDLKNNIADEAIKAVFSMRIEIGPPPEGEGVEGALLPGAHGGFPPGAEALPPGGDGFAMPQFATVPSGEIAPQPVAQPSAPRMDPATAEKLLGPAPRYEATQVHTNLGNGEPAKPKQNAAADKVGRNDLCPCGSGKKYKRCHGAAA